MIPEARDAHARRLERLRVGALAGAWVGSVVALCYVLRRPA